MTTPDYSGVGSVVIRIDDQKLRRQATITLAVEEARRLARKEGAIFIVYAPIKVVSPVLPETEVMDIDAAR